MKNKLLILLVVSLLALTACSNKQNDNKKLEISEKELSKYEEARIITVNENNILVVKNDEKNPILIQVATKGSKIYIDQKEAKKDDLKAGMIVKIDFSGPMMMSYPGKMNSAYILASSLKPNQINDKVGFYVQVVNDMLEDEKDLKKHTKIIGLNLDKAPIKLNQGERDALEYKLKEGFEMELIFTNLEKLKRELKIKDEAWKDGLLITFKTNDKEEKMNDINFMVEKWKSAKSSRKVDSAIASWDEKGRLKKIEYK